MRKFKCEACNLEFTSDRSDEDAEAEAKQMWGDLAEKDRSVICHDCFIEMDAWLQETAGHA